MVEAEFGGQSKSRRVSTPETLRCCGQSARLRIPTPEAGLVYSWTADEPRSVKSSSAPAEATGADILHGDSVSPDLC
jgi:hypothetical protein